MSDKINTEGLWTDEGKIDFIKFVNLYSSLNKLDERDEALKLLTFLGIKYEEK